MPLRRWTGRAIGLDVQRDFCVVAICEDGEVRVAGRVPSMPEGLTSLAQSLVSSDRVALEVTGSCWEIAAVERLIAQQALDWPEIRRLMTVPGVNLICAATFIAAVGNPRRFLTSRKLVAYLGLDPKVRQSGDAPARSGRISKRGSAAARWALVEAAWSVVPQPGPLHP